jgi:hypothetical protein
MSGPMLVGIVLGVLILIGVAGFLFDLFRRRQSPRHDEMVQRRANETLRYYRDVGDSNNAGGW